MTISSLPPTRAATAAHPGSRARQARTAARRSAAFAELAVPARQRRVEALLFALRHGRPVNADALSLILVAKQRTGAPLDRWRGDEVSRLVWIDLVELAEELDVALPADTAVTLWTALDAWADLAVLAPGSDSIAQLREPLCAMAGLDAHGRPRGARRHPSAQPAPRRRGRSLR